MDRPLATMDTDHVWDAVDTHRTAVADLLADLDAAEWDRPSLCDGWTVRDVAAHLTLQELRARDVVALLAEAPGRMLPAMLRGPSSMTRESVRGRAARPTDELVRRLRASVGTHRSNVGVGPRESLIDTLVHSQDIAVPLGRALALRPDAAAVALSRVWQLGWPFHARRRLAGFHLVATDVAWSGGEGRSVEGPVTALLLVATGRPAGVPSLSGPGAAALAAQLATAH